MNQFIFSLIGAVGVPLLLFLWQALLSRERVVVWGERVGVFCRVFLFQKIGAAEGSRLAARLVTTVADFVEGLYHGLSASARTDQNAAR